MMSLGGFTQVIRGGSGNNAWKRPRLLHLINNDIASGALMGEESSICYYFEVVDLVVFYFFYKF
jgi:hypothetical protein